MTAEKPSLRRRVRASRVFRSVFRHGAPTDNLNRALAIVSNVFLHAHPVKVHVRSLQFLRTFCLGGITFLLFLITLVTGVLLMFYYVPDVNLAYQDMKDLAYVVPFGQFLRNLHRWAAEGMVLTVLLHMARVFYSGSYRPPREFNWVIGVGLLVMTLLLSYTGYLLPWDQLAYWAITVGANMAGSTPVVGHSGPFSVTTVENDVRALLLGGTVVGQSALLRFYVLHCIALPLFLLAGMAAHFWRVRKDGGLARPL
jgi:quinol-cytochrome oxidoreductase complex cytochrome b subunit